MTDHVERVARKLRPLLPEAVDRWLQARQTTDPNFRGLIDRQILHTVQRYLGSPDHLLLSLPPAKIASPSGWQQAARSTTGSRKRMIQLGTVLYEKGNAKWPITLSHDELLQHLALFGRSGAGKTNVVFHLLLQLIDHGISLVILDWKRNFRDLLPLIGQRRQRMDIYTPGRSLRPFPFNPFRGPPDMEQAVYTRLAVDLFAQAYTLGAGASSLLHKAIDQCHERLGRVPSVNEILEAVQALPSGERVGGWKISAVRALETLAFTSAGEGGDDEQLRVARSMLNGYTILELDALSQAARKFLIPLICLWIYHARLAAPDREQLNLVIVIEEAHHVMHRSGGRSTSESLMERLMRQFRELGVGVVLADQHPSLINSAVLGNTYTSICLNLKAPDDLRVAAALSLMDEADRNHLSRLPVGTGVVKLQDRWKEPVLVRFPKIELTKGLVTDEQLAQRGANAGRSAGPSALAPPPGQRGQTPGVPVADQALDRAHWRLLHDVNQYPHSGVRERYQRLGWSGGGGDRVKSQLLAQGWLTQESVPVGNSRKAVLKLTDSAQQILDIHASHDIEPTQIATHESMAHAYWKNHYAQQLTGQGYRVEVEAARSSDLCDGRVDVLATKNGQRIGIEIETGKSDAMGNVRRGLRAGFDRVIVIATDAGAYRKVERQLLTAGLLIPPRVVILHASSSHEPLGIQRHPD